MFTVWRRWAAAARGLRPRRASTVAEGPARGLRFDPGPGDPAYATGAAEPPVQTALAARLRPGDVVLDVGANVGFLSVVAASLVGPAGRVIAFEPVPANARRIPRNARLNRLTQITVVPCAVGDRDGTATLVLARHAGGAALSEAGAPPDARGRRRVPIRRLDTWLAGAGLPPPALVKIDVEGAELAVLRGLGDVLTAARPALLIEVDDATAAGVAAKAAACADWCAVRGYRVERLPDAYLGLAWHVVHLLATPS